MLDIVYADGSHETPTSELREFWIQLNKIRHPEQGRVYMVQGKECLCLNPSASYGGGGLPLWAVKGHSAQLTLNNGRRGYVKGKCLSVSESPFGIVFQPNKNGWESRSKSREEKFLNADEIRRYDTNWR